MLERGREFQRTLPGEFNTVAVAGMVRLARLAQQASTYLRDSPDADVRRSAALLAARAHPVLAAFDESA